MRNWFRQIESCVCVCVRERERERVCAIKGDREKECVWSIREREGHENKRVEREWERQQAWDGERKHWTNLIFEMLAFGMNQSTVDFRFRRWLKKEEKENK